MNAIVRVTLFGMLVSGMAILSATPAESEPGPKKHKKDRHAHALAAGPVAAVHAWFSPREVQLYGRTTGPGIDPCAGLQAAPYRAAAAGMAEEARTLPVVLMEFVVLPRGYRRGVIDGQAVVVDPRPRDRRHRGIF